MTVFLYCQNFLLVLFLSHLFIFFIMSYFCLCTLFLWLTENLNILILTSSDCSVVCSSEVLCAECSLYFLTLSAYFMRTGFRGSSEHPRWWRRPCAVILHLHLLEPSGSAFSLRGFFFWHKHGPYASQNWHSKISNPWQRAGSHLVVPFPEASDPRFMQETQFQISPNFCRKVNSRSPQSWGPELQVSLVSTADIALKIPLLPLVLSPILFW